MSIITHLHVFKPNRKPRKERQRHVPRRRAYFESAAESRAREHL